MHVHINKKFNEIKPELETMIRDFDSSGEVFISVRNTIKIFDVNGLALNVKSFRIPNAINQLVYRFFRPSKAQRSFNYAQKLTEMGIGTPEPVAYFEFKSWFLFRKSFYVSENLKCEYTFRDLTRNFEIPDYETILRAFTRFTYKLHQNNVLFLDHSPGNTLIRKTEKGYEFFLVDLNRMHVKPLDFETRIKNFSRLTTHKHMIEIMSDEYSQCSGENYQKTFDLMMKEMEEFQYKFRRKKRIKKKLKFWK